MFTSTYQEHHLHSKTQDAWFTEWSMHHHHTCNIVCMCTWNWRNAPNNVKKIIQSTIPLFHHFHFSSQVHCLYVHSVRHEFDITEILLIVSLSTSQKFYSLFLNHHLYCSISFIELVTIMCKVHRIIVKQSYWCPKNIIYLICLRLLGKYVHKHPVILVLFSLNLRPVVLKIVLAHQAHSWPPLKMCLCRCPT